MSCAVLGGGSIALPSTPMPPALDTAVTSGGYETNPMPALTNGNGTPYSIVKRVCREGVWASASPPAPDGDVVAARARPVPAIAAAALPPSSASSRRRLIVDRSFIVITSTQKRHVP